MAAEASERVKAARKLAATAEAELKLLWKRRDEIDAALASPQSNGGKPVGELLKARAEVERQVVAAEQRWFEASEAAEQAKAG